VTPFAVLPNIISPSFWGLDELHLIHEGIAVMIQDLILANNTPKANKYAYTHSKSDLDDSDFDAPEYTFTLSKTIMTQLGQHIELNKTNLPASFLGSWQNITESRAGFRAVDFGDVLIFANPCIIAPLFERAEVRTALIMISRACELSMLWELNSADIDEIKRYSIIIDIYSCFILISIYHFRCVKGWHDFLKAEIAAKRLSKAVFTITTHSPLHIPFIVEWDGPLVAISARSMERSIGKVKKLTKSKSDAGANAKNMLELITMINQLTRLNAFDRPDVRINKRLEYGMSSYITNPSQPNSDIELWEPIHHVSFSAFPSLNLNNIRFNTALQKYYENIHRIQYTPLEDEDITVAGRLWMKKPFGSELDRIKKNEVRRSNHYVWFLYHLGNR
jgi:hypothetical protein